LPSLIAEARELGVVANGEYHVTVRRREILVGDDAGMAVTQALRRFPGRTEVQCLVGKAGNLNVEQKNVDVLPLPGLLAMGERGQDGIARVQTGQHISQRHAHFHGACSRFAVRHAAQAHQAAQALNY
jgi:hypothetical protein